MSLTKEHSLLIKTEEAFDDEENNEDIATCMKNAKKLAFLLSCDFKMLQNYALDNTAFSNFILHTSSCYRLL